MYCIGQTMSIKYHVQRLIEQFWAATLRPFWRHSLWIRLALVVSDLTLQVTGDHCVFIKITVLLRPRPVHVDIPVQIQRRSWLHTHTTLSIYSTHRVGENMIVHLRGDFSRLNNVNFFMFMHTEDLPRKRVHWPPPQKKIRQKWGTKSLQTCHWFYQLADGEQRSANAYHLTDVPVHNIYAKNYFQHSHCYHTIMFSPLTPTVATRVQP